MEHIKLENGKTIGEIRQNGNNLEYFLWGPHGGLVGVYDTKNKQYRRFKKEPGQSSLPITKLDYGQTDVLNLYNKYNGGVKASRGRVDTLAMATIRQKHTGLSGMIWVDDKGLRRDLKHNQKRLKYGKNVAAGEYVTITFINKGEHKVIGDIDKAGVKDINKVGQWIDKNYDLLIDLYKGEIEFLQFILDQEKV